MARVAAVLARKATASWARWGTSGSAGASSSFGRTRSSSRPAGSAAPTRSPAALDLHNLLTVSEAITRCALERKESRGGHFRDDYPDKDPACATFNLIVRKGRDGEMELSRAPLPEMPAELKAIIEANT
ncbi:MAG: hypothetical protein ABJA98_22415 [Acidobacteriota bacterium]